MRKQYNIFISPISFFVQIFVLLIAVFFEKQFFIIGLTLWIGFAIILYHRFSFVLFTWVVGISLDALFARPFGSTVLLYLTMMVGIRIAYRHHISQIIVWIACVLFFLGFELIVDRERLQPSLLLSLIVSYPLFIFSMQHIREQNSIYEREFRV